MAPLPQFMSLGFGAEILYSFIIIICSLMIYFSTKKLYELSSYKGINYFRKSFLFFAIAYFFRSFIKFIIIYFGVGEIFELGREFGIFTMFIFIYFSLIAVFYLLYSMMWKKWNESSKKIRIFHAVAILISIVSLLLRNPAVYFILNILVLIFAICVFWISHKSSKNKRNELYYIYFLLLIFWILNVIDILLPRFLENVQLLIYLVSSGIFLTILYKVLKKVG